VSSHLTIVSSLKEEAPLTATASAATEIPVPAPTARVEELPNEVAEPPPVKPFPPTT